MKRLALIFALTTLAPAALHAAPVAANGAMLVPICTGDGQTRLVPLPSGGKDQPDPQRDCVKGCHAGSSRKRAPGLQFEPAQ